MIACVHARACVNKVFVFWDFYSNIVKKMYQCPCPSQRFLQTPCVNRLALLSSFCKHHTCIELREWLRVCMHAHVWIRLLHFEISTTILYLNNCVNVRALVNVFSRHLCELTCPWLALLSSFCKHHRTAWVIACVHARACVNKAVVFWNFYIEIVKTIVWMFMS